MPTNQVMRALRAHSRGGPERFTLEEVTVPHPASGEVLVSVDAAAITFGELDWDLSWQTRTGEDRTPVVPSHEVAGRVVAVGLDVVDLTPGDQVYGLVPFDRNGAAADLVTVPADCVAPAPTTVGSVEAAALPLAALTAWQALVDHAKVEAGEEVLVHGGAGGVGSYVVQLAVSLGAKVTATAREDQVAFVVGLGAHRVIDYETEAFHELLSDVDVAIDTIGGEVLRRTYAVLRLGGRLVTLAAPPDQQLAGSYGVDAMFFVVEPDRAELSHLARMVDDGSLRPIVSQTFPLAEGRQAYESLTGPRPPGKTVLLVDLDPDSTNQKWSTQ